MFKQTLVDSAREACGTKRVRNNKKYTSWWSEEIKQVIKTKKNLWEKHKRIESRVIQRLQDAENKCEENCR